MPLSVFENLQILILGISSIQKLESILMMTVVVIMRHIY